MIKRVIIKIKTATQKLKPRQTMADVQACTFYLHGVQATAVKLIVLYFTAIPGEPNRSPKVQGNPFFHNICPRGYRLNM